VNSVNPNATWSPEHEQGQSGFKGPRFRVLVLESPHSDDGLTNSLNTGAYEIDRVLSVTDAEARLHRERFDLVILEIALPEGSLAGIELLERVRQRHTHLPVVLIGRSTLLRDRVSALDAGADDYLVEPVNPDEVRVRVRAVLRRAHPRLAYNIAQRGVHLDWAARTARVSDRLVSLTAPEFDLLEVLAQRPGQVLSSRELADLRTSKTDQISAFVLSIRRKLGDHVIETVRGRGYRLGLI
jgi:DNA-binding response OmpR family regulator